MAKCISFSVGPANFAFRISDIQEIIQISKLNETSLKIGTCIGSIDLRGATVPIIDFPVMLNYRNLSDSHHIFDPDNRVLVMRLEDELFGLLVDSVDSIIPYHDDDIVTFPMFEQNRIDMFIGCITDHKNQDVLLLNYEKILSDKEISNITHGHSNLYKNDLSQKAKYKMQGNSRKTYISFRLDTSYAVAISDIKEIIEYPEVLLQPLGLQQHFKGVLNLRGNLVSIIDARSVYHMKAQNDSQSLKKVMIFEKDGSHFGMIVDEVESIISFSENEKISLSPVLYRNENKPIHQDVAEAIQVTDKNGEEKNLLIFNINSILERCTSENETA